MSLFRTFRMKERGTFEMRFQTYNTFNHAQFMTVNTSAQFIAQAFQTNPAFGQYTTGQARASCNSPDALLSDRRQQVRAPGADCGR